MNKQAVFNTVWLGMASQDFQPSVNHTKGSPLAACRYRSDNNHRCHIGHLIQDDEYDPFFEAARIPDIMNMGLGRNTQCPDDVKTKAARFINRIGISGNKDIEFLSSLQNIHDRSRDIRTDLTIFADTWDLDIPLQNDRDI